VDVVPVISVQIVVDVVRAIGTDVSLVINVQIALVFARIVIVRVYLAIADVAVTLYPVARILAVIVLNVIGVFNTFILMTFTVMVFVQIVPGAVHVLAIVMTLAAVLVGSENNRIDKKKLMQSAI
jgi:hypothetical protein